MGLLYTACVEMITIMLKLIMDSCYDVLEGFHYVPVKCILIGLYYSVMFNANICKFVACRWGCLSDKALENFVLRSLAGLWNVPVKM